MRCFVLLTGSGKAYLYREGYMRTACSKFKHGAFGDTNIHLTNTAVQSKNSEFGRYEEGNQLDWREFQACMDATGREHVRFFTDIYPRLRNAVAETVRAVAGSLNPTRYEHCFELFGYDFMLDEACPPLPLASPSPHPAPMDEALRLLLLEVNSNPCLEVFNMAMGEVLQQLVDDIFVLTVDRAFPPPAGKSYSATHNFDLVFDPTTEHDVEPMAPWHWEEGMEGAGSPKRSPVMERKSVVPVHVSGSNRSVRLGAKLRSEKAALGTASAHGATTMASTKSRGSKAR
jgi:hypothetical protein